MKHVYADPELTIRIANQKGAAHRVLGSGSEDEWLTYAK
jgi:hypothetical protein